MNMQRIFGVLVVCFCVVIGLAGCASNPPRQEAAGEKISPTDKTNAAEPDNSPEIKRLVIVVHRGIEGTDPFSTMTAVVECNRESNPQIAVEASEDRMARFFDMEYVFTTDEGRRVYAVNIQCFLEAVGSGEVLIYAHTGLPLDGKWDYYKKGHHAAYYNPISNRIAYFDPLDDTREYGKEE